MGKNTWYEFVKTFYLAAFAAVQLISIVTN